MALLYEPLLQLMNYHLDNHLFVKFYNFHHICHHCNGRNYCNNERATPEIMILTCVQRKNLRTMRSPRSLDGQLCKPCYTKHQKNELHYLSCLLMVLYETDSLINHMCN